MLAALFKGNNLAINAAFILLLSLGLVMVLSSSILLAERMAQNPWYFFQKQLFVVFLGIFLMLLVYQVPLQSWQQLGFPLLFVCLLLLAVVLIPGVGKEVNGSRRWLNLGITAIQVSEFVKLFFAIYLAGYLVRRQQELSEHLIGVIKPFVLTIVLGGLLLLQPDFGSLVVLVNLSKISTLHF